MIEAFAHDGEAYLAAHLTPPMLSDPQRTAREVLPGYLRSFADNPSLTRLMLQEFSVLSDRHAWVVEMIGKPVWARLRPLFDALAGARALGGTLSGAHPREGGWIEKAIEHMIRPIATRE